jgi:octaprenyl-diphosphate synthase
MLKTKAPNVTLSPLQEAQGLLQNDLDKMEHLLWQEFSSKAPLVNKIAEYLMDNPGKGLRSILTFLSARVCNPEPTSKAITLAACVELIHMATLLHDDVIDESDVRRNTPCVRRVWGNQASILMGDFLFSRAFEMVMAVESWPLLKILSKTIASMAEGELLQMSVQENLEIDEDTYFQIIQAKTATLFSAACQGGALVVSASSKETLALESYGYNLGILFQLIDDHLDGDLNDLSFFSHKSVLEKAEFYRQTSLNALEIFPESAEKTILKDLVNFCLHRKS